MKAPLVSILMSIYNEERNLINSIKSIDKQTLKNWELIIIDDGSSDKSFQIISKILKSNPKIKLIKNKKNLGLAKSLNKGIKIAKAKFIARVDADDVNLPSRLYKQYQFMKKNKKIDALGTGAWLVDRNGKRFRSMSLNKKFSFKDEKIFSKSIFFHPSVMFRKSFFQKFGYYDSSFLRAQDKELWLRSLSNGAVLANLSDKLIEYNTKNYIQTWINVYLTLISLIRIQKKFKFKNGYIFIAKFVLFSVLTNLKIYKPMTNSFFIGSKIKYG